MLSSIQLTSGDQASVRLYPERGGIVTSLYLGGVELFYQGMLQETLPDMSKTVKGGIPILFPNAGPLTDDQQKKSGYRLAQHGFARNNAWRIESSIHDGQMIQSLDSAEIADTFDYQFDGKITNTIRFLDSMHCEFDYTIQNRGGVDLPVSFGLHPYFDLPLGDKSAIGWNFVGGKQIQDEIDIWSSGGTTMIDIPEDGKMDIFIPGIGNICISVSPDLRRLWIWSLPGKNFVCIEPVMGDPGNIVENPLLIPPYSEHKSSMKIGIRG